MTDLDRYDRAILAALQQDGALTNAELSERVNLSPSQCSRRRLALERAGAIAGYQARLSPRALGFGIHAFTRVNLRSHGRDSDGGFADLVARLPQVRRAHSVSGDADYLLEVVVEDVDALAAFVHDHLLPHPQIAQVRSEIVLKSVKDAGGVPL